MFTNFSNVGACLALYACLSMLGAAVVLATSAPELMRAASIQGIFPLLALVFFGMGVKQNKPKT